ncbi:Urea transporter, putative, partial [Perkinsus marinus ATCC 50983]
YDDTSTSTTAIDITIKRNWAEKWVDYVDSSKWLSVFFCEAQTIKPAIPNKEESRGLKGFWKEFVWFISAVIRGMAQLTWNDNIWTGLGILAGACVGNWCVGICAFIGCCYTTGFPLLFGPPELKPLVGSGIYGLNGTLLGMAMGCFDARASQARAFDDVMRSCCRLFLPLSFMAVFCAVVTQWLNTKWTAKTGIPACSWPYNISMWTWIACATLTTNFQTIYTANPVSAPQYGQVTAEWFFRSWMTGISQMMFSLNMWSGFCLLVGAFIGSPSSCFLTIWGSLIGVVTGVLLGMPFNSIIGLGVIGFNPIIYATGMGGQFVAPSLVGFIWMTFGCVLCGILAQLATNLAVLPWGGGSYSVPFTMMVTFMFGLFQEDVVAR